MRNIADPATLTSGWAKGHIGGGVILDGGNDYVAVAVAGSYNNFAMIDFTVAGWIKTSDPGGQSCIASIAGSGSGWKFGYGGSKQYFLIGDNNSHFLEGTFGSKNISDGVWHHLLITYSRSDHKVYGYVDGLFNGSVDISVVTGSVSYGVGVWLGTMEGTVGRVKGTVDDIRIYNCALTAREVLDLYNYSRVRIGDGAKINGLRIH